MNIKRSNVAYIIGQNGRRFQVLYCYKAVPNTEPGAPCPRIRTQLGGGVSRLLEPQSRFGKKPLKFQVVCCPQNGTAVLMGLTLLEPQSRFGDKLLGI